MVGAGREECGPGKKDEQRGRELHLDCWSGSIDPGETPEPPDAYIYLESDMTLNHSLSTLAILVGYWGTIFPTDSTIQTWETRPDETRGLGA